MGFLSNLLSATVKTAITPVAIVKDVVNVITGEEADSTKRHIESIVDDVDDAFDDIAG